MKATVLGFPRTGGTLIRRNLEHHCGYQIPIHQTHNEQYLPPEHGYIGILAKRHDVFASSCSFFIMHHSGESTEYTQRKLPKLTVQPEEFTNVYWAHDSFYQNIDLSPYCKTVTIWYEDNISDPLHLFDQLGIKKQTRFDLLSRCPYRAEDIISNLNELHRIFKDLTAQ